MGLASNLLLYLLKFRGMSPMCAIFLMFSVAESKLFAINTVKHKGKEIQVNSYSSHDNIETGVDYMDDLSDSDSTDSTDSRDSTNSKDSNEFGTDYTEKNKDKDS